MSTTVASPPPHSSPHAHLELLSSTAILKKVMDTKVSEWKQQQLQLQMQSPSTSPKKSEESTVPSATLTPIKSTVPPMMMETTSPKEATAQPLPPRGDPLDGPKVPNLMAEKSSSTQAAPVPPGPTTVSPIFMDGRLAYRYAVPTSYGSLLLAPPPAAQAAPHHMMQHHHPHLLALATNPMAAAHMMAAGSKVLVYGGGPSSAFQKPLVIMKEAAPDARQTSPTTAASGNQQQAAGERETTPATPSTAAYEALIQENLRLQQQMAQKDDLIATLQSKADGLETQIGELRQLPTGKISHIPLEDMIRIMQTYGSEVSNQTLPKRKQPIQKASIVRQFRRWNPEFFRFFVHVNGEWVPRLGKEGELKRRAEKRRAVMKTKRAGSPDSTTSHH
ncbi:expressed unknown protein [Seminavis robusta]|uniref:Uncharacterized protein n=1 Tax=Seminavis robusta TaxID=568900 RepID=A0A9N8HMB8_9STRA|nr:expressed unknown protein [Seminavis robusta]|eukprot:Sro894_g217130.1 n/a (390) ;mRNA; f:20761-22027